MVKLVARTTVAYGSCAAMVSLHPHSSSVLIGTTTGHIFLATCTRGRIRMSPLAGITGPLAAVAALIVCDKQLLVIRSTPIIQVYNICADGSDEADVTITLQCETAGDEAPKFRPLFLDKKTLFVASGTTIRNIFNDQEQVKTGHTTLLGMAQLAYDRDQFLLYGDGLAVLKWSRKIHGKGTSLQQYTLDLQRYSQLATEVSPVILDVCISKDLVLCSTNMGIILFFPKEQLTDSSIEETVTIYPMIYPTVALSVGSLVCWGDKIVPCGGHALELLTINVQDGVPEVAGAPVMTLEDKFVCSAPSEDLLWVTSGGAGVCVLSR